MAIHRPVLIQSSFFTGIDEGFRQMMTSQRICPFCLKIFRSADVIQSEIINGGLVTYATVLHLFYAKLLEFSRYAIREVYE